MLSIERVLDERRRKNRQALLERTEAAYALCPALSENDTARQEIFASLAKGRVTAAAARTALKENAARQEQLLLKAGLPLDTFTLTYDCPLCRDTGYVGTNVKKPCRCRLLLQAELDPRVSINSAETFEAFDPSMFADAEQLSRNKNAAAKLAAFVDAYPEPPVSNYLILGAPGLGKSYLGNACAYRALQNGIEAVRATAYDFLEDILKELRGEPVSRTRYRNAPLLVLDDLGTEAVIPNVSENALFTVIDGRSAKKLPTIYITNLSLQDLRDRYGDRIFSRLTDGKTTRYIMLQGRNLRFGNK